jgi:thiol-disulfide isomerase/thioredoxin
MRSFPLRVPWLASYMAALAVATLPAAALDWSLAVGKMDKLRPVEALAPAVTSYARPDGTEGTLSDYSGKVVVLNFWATWCAPCKAEMPSLQTLQDTLGGEGLQVVTVAFGRHNPMAMSEFWKDAGVTSLPLYLDAGTEMARAFGVVGLPHTFVLGRDGTVLADLPGEADWSAPETLALLRSVLEE